MSEKRKGIGMIRRETPARNEEKVGNGKEETKGALFDAILSLNWLQGLGSFGT
jgi:hypothetical protein